MRSKLCLRTGKTSGFRSWYSNLSWVTHTRTESRIPIPSLSCVLWQCPGSVVMRPTCHDIPCVYDCWHTSLYSKTSHFALPNTRDRVKRSLTQQKVLKVTIVALSGLVWPYQPVGFVKDCLFRKGVIVDNGSGRGTVARPPVEIPSNLPLLSVHSKKKKGKVPSHLHPFPIPHHSVLSIRLTYPPLSSSFRFILRLTPPKKRIGPRMEVIDSRTRERPPFLVTSEFCRS